MDKLSRGVLVRILTIVLLLALLLPGCSSPNSASPLKSGENFSFIVCGDPHGNFSIFSKVVEAAKGVDFMIIAGDLTEKGTPDELSNFSNFMKTSGVRFYCVPGNHDIISASSTELYSQYFGAPHQSFDYKNSHFVLIDNSNPKLGFYPEEQKWVEEDLKKARQKGFNHVFAVAHVPPGCVYSSRFSSESKKGIEANKYLVPILSSGGVEELFCGHFHVYSREKTQGMYLTITGGAGAKPHLSEENGGFHHYILVQVKGKQKILKTIRI
ncbi:MAG: metallophosphoesterase [Actinomycetota bacterium]|nr:metallophosphoesterase [Actinomycetota bacterium]